MGLKPKCASGPGNWSEETRKCWTSRSNCETFQTGSCAPRTMNDRHIARELHDSAGQILTALGMSLGNIGQRVRHDPQLFKGVEDSRELVQQLSKEIRTTSYLLHPPLLDENGLPEAIRWYVQGL